MLILRRAVAVGAACSIAALGRYRLEAQRAQEIPTLQLNTGARIPALGFGTYLANGDELAQALRCAGQRKEVPDAVLAALLPFLRGEAPGRL